MLLQNYYDTLQMPAVAKQTVKSLDGVIRMDAINPKTLLSKYAPKVSAYLNDKNKLLASLNPFVIIAVGVICVGMVVAVISVIATKAKERLPAFLIRAIDKLKAIFLFNLIIVSLQTSYLNLCISTYQILLKSIKSYIELNKSKERILAEGGQIISIKQLATDQIGMIALFFGLILVLVFVIRLLTK